MNLVINQYRKGGGQLVLKIMIVDDEQWCLNELSGFITSTGDAVIVGEYLNPMDALTAVWTESPDIAFIDVIMPGMTGLELAKKLKRQRPKMRIVLISENASYASYAFEIGVDDYLLKPIRIEKVLKALQKVG